MRGVFLASEPGNLVGHAVVEAVMLEQASGLKGPRILLSERLARATESSLRDWLLRPTSAPRVWEVLWPLPSTPADSSEYEASLQRLCEMALRLLALGGDAAFGAHYREFILLATRSIARLKDFVQAGRAQARQPSPRSSRKREFAACSTPRAASPTTMWPRF